MVVLEFGDPISRADSVDVKSCNECVACRRVFQALQRFAVLDLSNFYLDVAKDRLYIRSAAAPDRRACQTVMAAMLEVGAVAGGAEQGLWRAVVWCALGRDRC